jgi:magnesium transporter
MELEHMPELQYRNGYFAVIGVMVLIVMGLSILKKDTGFKKEVRTRF